MKTLRITLIVLPLFLFSLSCNEKGTEPPEEKPPGYQEDIPWPSLADSPWPMNHHDPQSTGRSNNQGPSNGIIYWEKESNYTQAGIVISTDSLIYYCPTGFIRAVSANGNVLFEKELNNKQIFTTPLIDKFGNIYIADASDSGNVYSFNKVGTQNWKMPLGNPVLGSMMNIDKEGKIYVISEQTINSINIDGKINWKYKDSRIFSGATGISFSPDSKTLYIPGWETTLIAFDIQNQTIKWTYGNSTNYNAPIVDNDGKIYLIPKVELGNTIGKLICLNDKGNLIWEYVFHNISFGGNKPTIDRNGNIYIASDSLICIDYSGELKWKTKLHGICDAPLVCDDLSNIYLMTQNGSNNIVHFLKYNHSGSLLWELSINSNQSGNCPAIDNNKQIYFANWRGTEIYAIR